MKKIIIAIVLTVIAVIVFFAVKSCEPRVKNENENSQNETTQETDYKVAFIEANTEFTCEILKNPTIKDNEEQLKILLNQSYKKYGFPTEDDLEMIKILNEYEDKEDIINEIKNRVKNCPSQ